MNKELHKRYKCEECNYETDLNYPPYLYYINISDGYWIVCKKCFIRIHKSLGKANKDLR